ncbi:LON peptidase substrate-binding domain-containing protein [Azomonas macrocytogenes]|uniref:Lon N-terminal domain-containing protein n=1 Tax=Azomonas macrocytogenes TaxID=69962 RepID=A0A839SZC3_AZOMA|nr:LON peptidase substrate-binding domain-containing protein [Azomonas macrocytogenes]MBB3102502.1 hypothetical protein [Azomonas macrocytogenes]
MSLPLFALNTVLFPGCMLDLQVFEVRYLDMLKRCFKAGHGFGVVCIREGSEVGEAAQSFASIGCEALIGDWQQQPNGLLGIRVEGGRRFEVVNSKVQDDQLIVADVRWLPAIDELPLEDRHADLAALLDALGQHPMVESLGLGGSVGGQDALANRLAYLLPFSPEQKLSLLATAMPGERLETIQALLKRLKDGEP